MADPETLGVAVEGVDVVVHLAAVFSTEGEDAIRRANLGGTRNRVAAEGALAGRPACHEQHPERLQSGHNADATRPALETEACSPTAAYGASEVAAEQLLRGSGLTQAVLRLPFVHGGRRPDTWRPSTRSSRGSGLHRAQAFLAAHHRDIAAAVRLAPTGVMDGRIVHVTDDAPVTVLEKAHVAEQPIEGLASAAQPVVRAHGRHAHP